MIEETVNDYSEYMKLDMSNEMKNVQDVIDNMLTRLEELTSVLQIIKSKNCDCKTIIREDINNYRSEVSALSKKIKTLQMVINIMNNNILLLEKQVEKAEQYFEISNESRIRSFLNPFFKKTKENNSQDKVVDISSSPKIELQNVWQYFEGK